MKQREMVASGEEDGNEEHLRRQRLQSLPVDAISSILGLCSDFDSIKNLGQNDHLRQTIYNQHWKCMRCQDEIFKAADLRTDPHASPFMCQVCQQKFCGQAVDYDKRFCRPQTCDGCGKVECHRCMSAHMVNGDGYGTENFCEDCQAEFDFGMGGC